MRSAYPMLYKYLETVGYMHALGSYTKPIPGRARGWAISCDTVLAHPLSWPPPFART